MNLNNPFRKNQRPLGMPKPKKDDCKIKIKTKNGQKEISFSGECSKEQIQVAKDNLNLEEGKE